ncbi:Hypothetical protein KVN_LOCUS227 [uncultured virus]|nr:Hypothetical protein KVN_LOCUS227 [uncultured virus]
MSLKIISDDNKNEYNFKILFDKYGNLYLDGNEYQNNEFFEETYDLKYQLSIEKIGLIFDKINFDSNKLELINYSKIFLYEKDFNLRKKIKDEINNFDFEDNDDEYLDEDQDYDKYYPEDLEYYEDNLDSDSDNILDEDIICQYGESNKPFIFSNIDLFQIPICDIPSENICALYDTYIYDKNRLCFKTNSSDNSSIYRIKINNNELYLREIGCPDIKKFIKIDKNGIIQSV